MSHGAQLQCKKRSREFTGCWRCRERKVKCDESLPCSACKRLGFVCDGSSSRLVWLDEKKSWRSSGRRYMHCERTWGSFAPLESEAIDLLISQCDDLENERAKEPCFLSVDYNPFSVFPVLRKALLNDPIGRILSNGAINLDHAPREDRLLFQHYVDYVSEVMMPFEHSCNPWKAFYPSVSLRYLISGEKALYHAILAHSSFNLAYLGPENTRIARLQSASRHYNISIQYVNDSIASSNGDYGSTLAAIMTLMMAEVYSGQSRKWKYHLRGAWALLLERNGFHFWNDSPFTRFSVQSLLIVRIIEGTTLADDASSQALCLQDASRPDIGLPDDCDHKDITCASSISSTPEFGFTIGAHKILLECISSITGARMKLLSCGDSDSFDVDLTISHVLSCLGNLRLQLAENDFTGLANSQHSPLADKLAYYQLNAFVYATYIYLYRSLLDVPPHRVAKYVSLVFLNTAAFYGESAGNFSLWPAFIAAVEAYTESDLVSARDWLERATNFGLGNRLSVQNIVEEVWRRREVAYSEENAGRDRGFIAVDWREIAKGLDADILLV